MMVDKAGENNVNPLQSPTNVVVSYVPAQPTWSDPYAAAAYDPNMYYQQQGMWAAQAGATTDAQSTDPNVANYYANMTQEEYAAAWATYYQQYQQYAAYSAMGAGEMPASEAQQPPEDGSLETAPPATNEENRDTAQATNAADENDEPTTGTSDPEVNTADSNANVADDDGDEKSPDVNNIKKNDSPPQKDDVPPAAAVEQNNLTEH